MGPGEGCGAFSVFHCMTVALSQGGAGLGTACGEQTIRELLHEAGFGRVETHRIEGDFLHVFYVARPR